MKSPIDITTHVAIMEWGNAFFDGDRDSARTELHSVAQKLAELGVTSRHLDEERTQRAQERIARLRTPDASRDINRSYLLMRDLVALSEDCVNPLEAMYRHPRSELLADAPVLTVVAEPEQTASSVAA